jgi:hypothetical protein
MTVGRAQKVDMAQLTPHFTAADAWSGGFYELVIELGDKSERSARHALEELWSSRPLQGIYLQRDQEPEQQPRLAAQEISLEGHWLGVATLPNGRQSCCGTFWGNYPEAGSWLTFYLPLGALAHAYPVGAYPMKVRGEPSPEAWLKAINGWMRELAADVYSRARFAAGVIGFEVDYFEIKAQLAQRVTANEWHGLLLPDGETLAWHPPLRYDPPYTLEKRLL